MSTQNFVAAIMAVLLVAGGWFARGWLEDGHELRVLQAINAAQDKAEAGTASEIAKMKVEQKTINNKVIEITSTKVVYEECKHSDDAFKLIKGLF
jgi:hypothetical protein